MTRRPWDPIRALTTLVGHRVRFVIIGGYAGRLLGSTIVTNDTDICYARDDENLRRLAKALRELNATLRGVNEDVPFILDARTLKAGDHFTFDTDAGALDILGTPAGVVGFDDLDRAATPTDLEGLVVRVVSIDDLIRMKRAAGRPQDLLAVEVLGALRDEIDARERAQRKSPRRRK